MCLAIEEMRSDAMTEGLVRGMEKGILGTIDICRDLGLDNNEIITRIIDKFSITQDEAEKYMRVALSNA